jgi:hypothetical protein
MVVGNGIGRIGFSGYIFLLIAEFSDTRIVSLAQYTSSESEVMSVAVRCIIWLFR